MNKSRILIMILSIILITLIVAIIINKKDTSSNTENVITDENYIPMSMRKNEDIIDALVEDLNKVGIILDNKTEYYSESLNEDGYKFTNEGIDIEIYQIDDIKLQNIIKSQDGSLVILENLDGDEIEAIYYGNILIITEDEDLKKDIIEEIGK